MNDAPETLGWIAICILIFLVSSLIGAGIFW